MIEEACSVNKDWNNDDTKTVVWTLSVHGGPCILLSPAGLTAAFKAILEMTGEQVSCQLGCQVKKREGGGCGGGREKEGKKWGWMGTWWYK